jgi:hypothetical protein
MAKYTLLDMTQSILSAMDSDAVSTIDETVEAVQVADLVKEAYFELLSQRDWPFLFELGELIALADLNNPTKMKMVDTWNKIKWIRYDRAEVEYLSPADFTAMIDQRTPQLNVVNSLGFGLNRNPTYWTSYDDEHIIFDSYNSTVESTLSQSKTKVYAALAPTWVHDDTFTPNIPEKFFPTLIAEAKAQSFINLKQQQNNREELKARRGRMTMRNEAWRNEYGETTYNKKVNYGRH